MIKKLKTLYAKLDVHTAEVVRKSAASTVVKVAGMVIGLLVSVFLGRTLGADGLGVVNLSIRISQLLLVFGLVGMRQVIIKEVAIAQSKKDSKQINNVMYTVYIFNGGVTTIVSLILILLTPWLTENIFHDARLTWPLIIALAVMTPQVFSRIFASGLVGFRKVWQSSLVEQTLSVIIVGSVLLSLYIFNIEIDINKVAIAYAIGRIFVTITVGIYWKRLFKSPAGTKPKFIIRKLIKTALPLFMVSITFVIASNADAIMLGWLGDAKMVGLYTVAARIALLTSFFLQITNAAVSPKIAALFAEGKTHELEKMVQSVTGGLLILAFAAFTIFILLGKYVLAIWGPEFTDAYYILIILSAGQLFNIGTGASGLLLMMCGLEKVHARISAVFVIVNLILNFVLIKQFGAVGAAMATAITVSGDNISRVVFAKIKLGVMTIPRIR